MSIGTLLYSRLTTDSGVSTLVSTRVYPVLLPQTPTLPAISYQRISNTEQVGTTSLRTSRYQVDCWDDDYSGVQSLAGAVKTALEEWIDRDQSPSVAMARVVSEYDDFEPETATYRVSIDILCNTLGD